MRTTEERIIAMHQRAAQLERDRRNRMVRTVQAAGALACLLIIVLTAAAMPGLSWSLYVQTISNGMSASIFSGSSILGFLLIGIVAFLLGAAFTIFCFHLKKWQHEKDSENDL